MLRIGPPGQERYDSLSHAFALRSVDVVSPELNVSMRNRAASVARGCKR